MRLNNRFKKRRKMTTKEAYEVIEGVVNSITANRASWKKIEEALETLKKLIEETNAKNSH